MRNIEALKNYFLGKDPQLKETMADNSLRLIGIPGKHFVLRTELLKRLAELRKYVDDSDKELQDAIDGLIHDLSLEEAAREGADRDLQNNIDAEANTRSTNDGLLQGQLNMLTPRVAGAEHDIDNLEAKTFFHVLTEDLYIPDNEEVTSLTESGWYYTGEHQVFFGNSLDAIVYTQDIFYFYADSGDQWFCFFPPKMNNGWRQICAYLYFDNIENQWAYDGIDITSSDVGISDKSTDKSVPTSKAVFDFVRNAMGVTDIHSDTKKSLIAKDGAVYATTGSSGDTLGDPVANGVYYAYDLISYSHNTWVRANNFRNGYCLVADGIIVPLSTQFRGYVTDSYIETAGAFTGCTAGSAGSIGLVPAPQSADVGKYLKSDGTWTDLGLSGKVNGNGFITDMWKGTQAEYDLLGTYSSTTLYIIE